MSGFADSINRSQQHIDDIASSLGDFFKNQQAKHANEKFKSDLKSRMRGQSEVTDEAPLLKRKVQSIDTAKPKPTTTAPKSTLINPSEAIGGADLEKRNPAETMLGGSLTPYEQNIQPIEAPELPSADIQAGPAPISQTSSPEFTAPPSQEKRGGMSRLEALQSMAAEYGDNPSFLHQLDIEKKIADLAGGGKMTLEKAIQNQNSPDQAIRDSANEFVKNYTNAQGGIAKAKFIPKPEVESLYRWVSTYASATDPKVKAEAKAKIDEYTSSITNIQRGAKDPTLNWANGILSDPSASAEEKQMATNFKLVSKQDAEEKRQADYKMKKKLISDRVSTGGLTKEAIEQQASTYLKSGKMTSMGMGNAGARVAILNRAAEIDPNANITGTTAYYDALKSSLAQNTKIFEATTNSAAAAKSNIELAVDMIKGGKIQSTGLPLLNKGANWWAENINGSPQLSDFEVKIFTAAREYAKVVTGSSASIAELSAAASKKSDELLNAAMNPDQFESASEAMKADMDNNTSAWGDGILRQVMKINGLGGIDNGVQQKTGGKNNSPVTKKVKKNIFTFDKTKEYSKDEQANMSNEEFDAYEKWVNNGKK